MKKQGHGGRRIVLVPLPLQGHVTPMLQLATILHSKGFSITVAHAQLNSPQASNHPDFTFISLSDGSLSTPKISDHFLDFTANVNLNCRAPLQEALTKIIGKLEQQEEELPCVIHDGVMHCAEAVAHHLKLPSIVLYCVNPTNLLAYYALPRLLDDDEGYALLELVPGLDPLRFKDLPVSNSENLRSLLPLIDYVRDIRSSSAIIFNSNECLEQSSIVQLQQQYPVPIFSIGPMHKVALTVTVTSSCSLLKEDTSCIAWLDKQAINSVIYVSFGSLAVTNEKELAEMAWGLANSKQPFLWVLRPGLVHGSDPIDLLPDGFKESVGERGCIVNWAPQKEVLAHSAVGGFWTHCGWNSILESISEGVPMICRPAFGDQRVNARYVTHVWKVGFELELEFETDLASVIRRLMVEKEGEEMRQRALVLKMKVELCMSKEGSCQNSLNELVEHIMSV